MWSRTARLLHEWMNKQTWTWSYNWGPVPNGKTKAPIRLRLREIREFCVNNALCSSGCCSFWEPLQAPLIASIPKEHPRPNQNILLSCAKQKQRTRAFKSLEAICENIRFRIRAQVGVVFLFHCDQHQCRLALNNNLILLLMTTWDWENEWLDARKRKWSTECFANGAAAISRNITLTARKKRMPADRVW